MSTLYRLAFEEVACTDLCGMFALLFLIVFTTGVIGLVLFMLRAGLYPCKMVFPFSSLDKEEYELEEYRTYLQDDNIALSTESTTSETSSEASDTGISLNSSTILSPSGKEPRSHHKDLKRGFMSKDDEKQLSPPDSRLAFDQSQIYPPNANDTSASDSSDKCKPLSPHTSMHSIEKRSGRCTNVDPSLVNLAMRQHKWIDYFACFVSSPTKIGNRSGDKSE